MICVATEVDLIETVDYSQDKTLQLTPVDDCSSTSCEEAVSMLMMDVATICQPAPPFMRDLMQMLVRAGVIEHASSKHQLRHSGGAEAVVPANY